MPKVNQEEYELLKGLDDYWKWKWIARDSSGLDSDNLHSYSEKPYKDYGTKTWSTDDNRSFLIFEQPFQFIQWEDESPYNIAELIEEYEREEAEVKKDVEWFKEEFYKAVDRAKQEPIRGGGELKYVHIDYIKKIIDQLDESETLSEYWIEQKSIDTHVDTLSGEIQVTFRLDDLQNLFVPKQGLPVIPKFVADWIEFKKKSRIPYENVLEAIDELVNSSTSKAHDWVLKTSENKDTFARAWLDGFTIANEETEVKKDSGCDDK